MEGRAGSDADLRHEVQEVVVDGDIEMARVVVTGTVTAGFAGVEGTGRSFQIDQAVITHLRDGSEVLARREAQHQSKADCRYWQERDAGRRAQQPTHVEVDPDAWKAVKAKAAAQGRTVGTLVGHLVVQEIHRCTGTGNPPPLRGGSPNGQSQGRHANLFARLEVSKERWQQFRSIAAQRDITIARYVGILVEKAVPA